jgi:CRISPR-associated protein Csd1
VLKQLRDYAVKYLNSEPGFIPKHAAWALQFAPDGRFLGVVSLVVGDQKSDRGRHFAKVPSLSFPEMKAAGIPKAHPLLDTADRLTLLEVAPDDDKARQRFDFHLNMLRDAASRVPELGTLAQALADPAVLQEVQAALTAAGAKPNENVTFQIGDDFPIEAEPVHAWWREFHVTIKPAAGGDEMRCFITGQLAVPAPTHDTKIKGLASVGGRGMGDVVVGFDKDAFESYGLQQSANAACSEEAAAEYCSGLNHLIAAHSHRLAGGLVAHWYRDRVADVDDAMAWLYEGASDDDEVNAQRQARELLEAIHAGRRPDLGDNRYYAITLSGNSGRVVMRDWMEGRFEDLVCNIATWFDDLEIVHRAGGDTAHPPKFLAVLGATVRQLDDLVPPLIAAMWRAAVRNEPIPRSSLAQALLRVRADIIDDQPANHARMGLLKAYHLRKARQKGGEVMSDLKPYLNDEHPSAAYHCGRLMAVLAGLQHAALGDVGAGVVQRYYAAASTTPALVLGRLTRTAQFHINKLDGGLAYWYEGKLAGIWARLRDAVPRTLDLEDQSLFALGYYQQLADLRTKKSDTETSQEGNENG